MNKIYSIALVMTAGILLCTGCSVKEIRSLCPCTLVLDFSEVDTSVISEAELYIADGENFLKEEAIDVDGLESEYMTEVPRKQIHVGLWSGLETAGRGAGLAIPYGDDSPPVYFHVSEIDAEAEIVRETVRMHKNHCVMTVKFDWMASDLEKIVLHGNVDGYDVNGIPTSGKFMYELVQDEDGNCQAILPRQTDDSLALEINDGTGVLKRFPLGEYIAQSGYDWNEPDLKDIVLELDIAILQVSLTVQGWDTSHSFDIVI